MKKQLHWARKYRDLGAEQWKRVILSDSGVTVAYAKIFRGGVKVLSQSCDVTNQL